MQVTVEKTEGLERKMIVTLPQQKVDDEVQKKLRKLASEVNLKGFRPGKVPLRILKQRFGPSVTQEALETIVNETLPEALEQESLHIVGTPQIEINEGDDNEFSYTVVFDTYPEVESVSLDDISVERITAEIKEEDVDKMLEALREQRKTWTETDESAEKDNQLTIDFVGTIDGKAFAGGTANNQTLVLGSNSFITGFEDGLIGKKAGDEVTLTLSFPEDYHNADLSGQAVEFAVTVNKVEQSELPEIDEAFIKTFEIEEGTVEAFRTNIRNNMEKELDKTSKTKLKEKVLDAMLENNALEIPQAMIDSEAQHLAEVTEQDYKARGQEISLEAESFKASAEKRVKLGLLIGHIISENKLEADEDKVRAHIEGLAASYEQPESVVNWFYSDEERLTEIKTQLVEDDVVEWVLEKIEVVDVISNFSDIVKPQNQQFA